MHRDRLAKLRFAPILVLIAAPAWGLVFTFHTERGDAGDPLAPQTTIESGLPSLVEIKGTLGTGDVVDTYCIVVSDPAFFYATTNTNDDGSATASFDSVLALFTADRQPMMINDDSPSGGQGSLLVRVTGFQARGGAVVGQPVEPVAGGRYLLAITRTGALPSDAVDQALLAPGSDTDGLHGPNTSATTYDYWYSPTSEFAGAYTIRLAGAETCGRSLAFRTFHDGTGDLSTWPEAAGKTSLAAADQICRTSAIAAGLPQASSFVAWLSDASDDAYCRAHGLSGKKANNCGQASLPTGAGPWETLDGRPLGPRLETLLTAPFWHSPDATELGARSSLSAWSSTQSDGTYHAGSDCSGWQSDAGSGGLSFPTLTTRPWTATGTGNCFQSHRLQCLQPGAGLEIPKPKAPTTNRFAFFTSISGTGDLSSWADAGGQTGIAAGDRICQALATRARLPSPGSYKAWLSDGTVDAVDRFTIDEPWYRTDGILLATGPRQLQGGSLRTALQVDEKGTFGSFGGTYTGTLSTGRASQDHCSGWTSDTDIGTHGQIGDSWRGWTSDFASSCNVRRSLYCFSNATDSFFRDGFESGNLSAWSGSVP